MYGFQSDPKSGDNSAQEKALFEAMPVVEAAALHAQSLEEAPASVTVITSSDIRKYGYRTLAEALASVRGFYVTYDRIYHYVGVAGFSIPGDYNTRFLVMLNGHPLTENIYNSNGFFGEDFGLDMDLVERIEVIRGPSSALYGSNGILANINIVTKSPVDQDGLRVSSETGSFGEKKAFLSSSLYLGKGANLLLSGSMFDNGGQNLYIPQFDSPDTNFGRSVDQDSEYGYHTLANLLWRDWNITAYFNNRVKRPPVAWADSLFNDSGSRVRDSRNFIAATYTHDLSANRQLRWQLYYDNYRYDDRFDYARADSAALDDIRTSNRGDWVGSELTYRFALSNIGDLTLGAQTNFELRNLQAGYRAAPDYQLLSRVSEPDRTYALFAQQEWNLSRRWKAYFGVRFDDSANFGHFVSPRLALVYQQSPATVYKFVYGRPYRNPSTFERYYDDNGYSELANPALRPETAHTFEVSAERKLRRNVSLVADFYHYRVSNMISAATLENNVQQYVNNGKDHSTGIEFELSAKVWHDLEAAGSYSFDVAKDIAAGNLPNSPHHLGKFRLSKGFLKGRFVLSSSTQYVSARDAMSGVSMRPVLLEDITLSTRRLHSNFDVRGGIRNALNWHYDDPVYLAIDQLRQDGRSVFVKLIWHTRE